MRASKVGGLGWASAWVSLGVLAGCQVAFGLDPDALPAQDARGAAGASSERGSGGAAGLGSDEGGGGQGGAAGKQAAGKQVAGKQAAGKQAARAVSLGPSPPSS